MNKSFVLIPIMIVLLILASCHAVPPEETMGENPHLTNPKNTEPTVIDTIPTTAPTVPTTVPTEPIMPAEVVSEAREDGLVYMPFIRFYLSSGRDPLYFNLDESLYPGMQITFDVSVNLGDLCLIVNIDGEIGRADKTKTLTHDNNFSVHYEYDINRDIGNMDLIKEAGGAVFVDAVIRADGHIVGYGLFEIGTVDAYEFALMRAETVIFPMVDGQLQYITEEYVAERIAELKQIITPLDREAKMEEVLAYWEELLASKATEPTEG